MGAKVEDLAGRIAVPATKAKFYWADFPYFARSSIFLLLCCIFCWLQCPPFSPFFFLPSLIKKPTELDLQLRISNSGVLQ